MWPGTRFISSVVKAEDAYRTILGLVEVNDWPVFDSAARKLPSEFPEQLRSVYLSIGNTIEQLLRAYDYTCSVAFNRDTSSASVAVLSAKKRKESDPVQRKKRRQALFDALADLPQSAAAYDLVSTNQHSDLDKLREFVQKIRTAHVG